MTSIHMMAACFAGMRQPISLEPTHELPDGWSTCSILHLCTWTWYKIQIVTALGLRLTIAGSIRYYESYGVARGSLRHVLLH